MRRLLSLVRSAGEKHPKMPVLEFDLFSSEFRQNPYPYYKQLREQSPVHYFKKQKLWAVSRYADVLMMLKRPDLFSSSQDKPRVATLISRDPPEHTRWRSMLSDFFSERSIGRLEGVIQKYTNQSMERILARGSCELMSDIATPVPALIISEMLGIDPEHSGDLNRWTSDWIMKTGPQLEKSMKEFNAFSAEHVEKCEKGVAKGLIYDLLHPKSKDQRMTREEACGLLEFLIVAGTVTTTHTIGNAVLALLRNRDQMSLVTANLRLVPAVVEETLRYDPPAQMMPRTVIRDTAIAGVPVPAGAVMKLLVGSANRDERQFHDPDRFFIGRNAHGHLAFGHGIHHCIGARLARLESRIVLQNLFAQLPGLRADQDIDSAQPLAPITFHVRGVKSLKLAFKSPNRH